MSHLNIPPDQQIDTKTLYFQALKEQQNQQINEYNDEKFYKSLLNPLTTQLQNTVNDSLLYGSSLHQQSHHNLQSTVSSSLSQSQIFDLSESLSTTPILAPQSIAAYRRRSTGCFSTLRPLIPMQPLQESTSTSLSNLQQMQSQQHQQQSLEQQLSSMNWLNRSLNSFNPGSPNVKQQQMPIPLNQSSPIQQQSKPSRYRRQSLSGSYSSMQAMSSMSSGTGSMSTSNIWERVLQQQQQQQQNLLNSALSRTSTSNLIQSFINNNQSLRNRSDSPSQMKQLEEELAITGNMFHKRENWSILTKVPSDKRNTMHMRLEDDGPYGNDEIRCFVLSHFSSLYIREIECVLCGDELRIYDRFPLVDGTLFITPVKYDHQAMYGNNRRTAISGSDTTDSGLGCGKMRQHINAHIANKDQYIYGVCLACLNGANEIKCAKCGQAWKSQTLQIGTLYKYDIFAAFPCCKMRLECNKCSRQMITDIDDATASDGSVSLPYFSSYSEEIECTQCKAKDYHFIKPLNKIYVVTKNNDQKANEP